MSKCVSRSYTILALLIVFSLLPIFPHPSAVAATLSPTLTESTDGHALALHLSASQSSASQSAASLPMQGLLKYGTDAEALFSVLAVGTVQAIHITDTGFNPAELSVFGPTDVTWINETTITQTLQSGIPITTSTGNNIYLPVVQRGGAASFAAAANYLDLLMQQAMSEPTFSAILPPGQSFRYRYLKPGLYQYHLSSAPQFKGEVNLSGVALLRANPSNGENDVAVTRETILEFSDALDATTVTAAAFAVTAGNTSLDYRLNLSADKSRVTLFYKDALPGSVRVRVMVDGSQLKDGKGLAVDVNGDGVAGGTQVIEFDTLSLTILPGTSVCGRVFASELAVNASNVSVNTPLKGATVTVDGMEDALRTTSDDNGNFCLDPAPVGRFFVHIDGRSVTTDVPAGTYYPFVGKAWQSVAGQQTNVGDVFLPLIPAGTLQSVSADQNTQITFPDTVVQQHPELLGVSIVVPADSLYSDDGSRGGKVGIAPVPPDRLPGPLPPGLNFPVVITVQTDGAGNFDQPAPVCFPNLPDKDTGQPLPAGSKSALWSFNHDTGRFEIVGPMTVSADGKLACTDAGVGIKAPGWHGTQPGTPTEPCKLTKEDWINIAVDVGTAAVGCLSALTGVDNFIENVFKLSKEGRALLNNLESLYEASVNGSMTVVQIREYMKVIVSAKSVLEAATEALKKSAPTEKVLAALQCAESVLDGLIGVCDTVTKKGDQCISTWVKFTCNGLDVVRLIIARINSLSGAVEKGLAKLSLTVLCKTLDEMAKLLGIASGSVDAMALPLGDNEPVQPEILAEMQKAIVETNLFLADLIVIEDYAEELQQLAQEMETIHYQSELLNQPNPGFPINSYYLL